MDDNTMQNLTGISCLTVMDLAVLLEILHMSILMI